MVFLPQGLRIKEPFAEAEVRGKILLDVQLHVSEPPTLRSPGLGWARCLGTRTFDPAFPLPLSSGRASYPTWTLNWSLPPLPSSVSFVPSVPPIFGFPCSGAAHLGVRSFLYSRLHIPRSFSPSLLSGPHKSREVQHVPGGGVHAAMGAWTV
jgi:hypothetical protein